MSLFDYARTRRTTPSPDADRREHFGTFDPRQTLKFMANSLPRAIKSGLLLLNLEPSSQYILNSQAVTGARSSRLQQEHGF
jgi:hypothetical protein